MAPVSRRCEAQGANEGVEVIDDVLIGAIELRSLLLVDSSARADGAEKGEIGGAVALERAGRLAFIGIGTRLSAASCFEVSSRQPGG